MRSPEYQQGLAEARHFLQSEKGHLRAAIEGGLHDEAREYFGVLRKSDEYREARKMVLLDHWEKRAGELPEFSQQQWEDTGKALSGVNNGVKAALFLEIAQNTLPGTYTPVEDIVERFRGLFSGTEFFDSLNSKTKNSQPIKFCQESLCDVGLLTESYEIDAWGARKLVGFGVTEDGRKFGISHALAVLWYENNALESLYPVLGATNSRGETRSPANRARLLDFLVRHPAEGREADLIEATGIQVYIVTKFLENFSKFGFIDYTSVAYHTGKGSVNYQRVNDRDLKEAVYANYSHSLKNQIVEIIPRLNGQAFSAGDIRKRLPDNVRSSWQNRSLRHTISSILSRLAGQGLLVHADRFKGGEKQSDIYLAEKGRRLYFQLVMPTLMAVSGRPLQQGQIASQEKVRRNLASYARASADLYYPHSQSKKMRESRQNKREVFSLIAQSDGPMTIRELSEKVGLNIHTIHHYLSPPLPGSNEIIADIDGQKVTIQREMRNGDWYFSLKN